MLSSFFLSGLIVKKRIRKNKHEMLDEAVKMVTVHTFTATGKIHKNRLC
jgi:hypothetical protein